MRQHLRTTDPGQVQASDGRQHPDSLCFHADGDKYVYPGEGAAQLAQLVRASKNNQDCASVIFFVMAVAKQRFSDYVERKKARKCMQKKLICSWTIAESLFSQKTVDLLKTKYYVDVNWLKARWGTTSYWMDSAVPILSKIARSVAKSIREGTHE